jgi:hypothetical protein
MELPTPPHHSNPETFKEEPVYIFTDKAVVPPGKDNGTAQAPPPKVGDDRCSQQATRY